ncbi:MAG: MBG domain-containing protein [Ferruginibacter sp.]
MNKLFTSALSLVLLLLLSFSVAPVLGQATVTTDKDDYAPGEYVIITGTGWQPGETVSFHFDETPKPAACLLPHDMTVTADAGGNIYNNQFLINNTHLGVAFVLTATGQSSGLVATRNFTDANITVKATGLPSGTSLQVSYRLGSGSNVPTGTYTNTASFVPPASPTTFVANNNQYIDFTFPNIVISGVTYVSTTIDANGNTVSGPSLRYQMPNGNAKTFTGIYVATCTAPSIMSSPSNSVIAYGENAVFSTTATGSATLNYQWQVNTGSGWNNTSDADGVPTTFTVVTPTVSQTGTQYRVVVSNGCASDATSSPASLTVNAKALTVTANNRTKTYGTAVTFAGTEFTTSGLVNSDAVSSVTITSTGAAATATVVGSTYPIVASAATGAGLANYSISYVDGALTVNAKAATITANAKSKIYGDANPALDAAVTGTANGDVLNYSLATTATVTSGVGTYPIAVTLGSNPNYSVTPTDALLTVTQRTITIAADGKTKNYGDVDPALTAQATNVANGDLPSGNLQRAVGENVGSYLISKNTYTYGSNYNETFVGANLVIGQRPVTITADPKSKYCGQADPALTFTSSPAVGTILPNGQVISFTGALSRVAGENSQAPGNVYPINQGSVANSNYLITYNSANLTINGVSVDASATGNAIQLGTAIKTLSATVTSGTTLVSGASVTFKVTNNINSIVSIIPGTPITKTTGANGVATYDLSTGTLPIGLYAVTVTVGTGCAETIAYFSIYDPNAGFVTGGGWINSPAGAYSANPSLTGKANFGFNAQYKKGNNTPDGNTEFQFQTGDLKFKSSVYDLGSLVIAGAKATFKGTGTINGSGSYNFLVAAIDGSINGGGGIDKFRIKIWNGNTVIYDNDMGKLDNGDPSTALGGGSIVIHESKSTAKRTADVIASAPVDKPLTVKAFPSISNNYFTLQIESSNKANIQLKVVDLTGRPVELMKVVKDQTLRIGQNYRPGMYLLQVQQGNEIRVIKLVKE